MDLYYVNADTEEYIQYRKGDEDETISEVRRGWHFFSDCKMELSEKVFVDDRDAFLSAMKRKTLMNALEQKDTFVMTYRQIGNNGPFYVSMKISRMQDNNYIILGIENVDDEVRETLAIQGREAFLSDKGDELLSSINNIVELNKKALKDEKLDDETRNYLENIEENSKKLVDIINDFHEKNWIL